MMSGKSKAQQPPKYLNDFSHALAKEVQILLQEVGQLRDERRRLQYEIAELMAMKSKHGAGGEYTPDWKPKEDPLPPPEPLPMPPMDEAPQPAKPAWRTVTNYKQEKRDRKSKTPRAIAPPPAAHAPAPQPELPAWAQWKPNPLLSPQPRAATSSSPLPGPPQPKAPEGLFGPKTPPPK